MADEFVEISVNGIPFQIRKYAETPDHTLESLALIANAKALFFSIAEDSISVPPHLIDPASGNLISDKRKVVEMAVAAREALYEASGHDKFAAAKLTGAYVNMIELLADETLQHHYTGDATKHKQCRHEMGEYYKKVQALIPSVNLKGRKADVDKVLLALLGEVPKAALLPNKNVHDYEYLNIASAMYEVDHLAGWMQEVVAQTPAFAGCRDAIAHLAEAAKARMNLRREDLAARDASEVQVRQISRDLRQAINTAAKHDKKLHDPADDLLRATDIVTEMLRQGAKPVSVSLLMGSRQADMMAHTLAKILATLPAPATIAPRKALRHLHDAEKSHLQNMLRHGNPREYFASDFARSLEAATQAEFDLPATLAPGAQAAIATFRKGVEIMGRIPPGDLAQDNDSIVKAHDAVTGEIAGFAAQQRKQAGAPAACAPGVRI